MCMGQDGNHQKLAAYPYFTSLLTDLQLKSWTEECAILNLVNKA